MPSTRTGPADPVTVMTRMSADTVARLRLAVADPVVVDRYRSHIRTGHPDQCWLWTGAISGRGHGRFQIADQRLTRPDGTPARRTFVVIAHRFGYAALNGVDALLQVPIMAHSCDNPICQNPRCWRESDHHANGRDYAHRRDLVRGPLTDTRGARGRTRAIRDAARAGADINQAVLAGWRPVHRAQLELELDLFPDRAVESTASTDRDDTDAACHGHCDRWAELGPGPVRR
jgi:hypothetical protein